MVDTLVESTSNVEVIVLLTSGPFYLSLTIIILSSSILYDPKKNFGYLQLILNYFKLFLLLPSEEVCRVPPLHPLHPLY